MSTRAERAVDAHGDELIEKANVVSVGAGAGEVIAFVTEKKPLSALSTEDVVPGEVDGVPTDVIEVGNITAMLDTQSLPNVDTGTIGSSLGHARGGSGTLGAVVRDRFGQHFALTNEHVAAGVSGVQLLDWVHAPGPADRSPTTSNRLGRLHRYTPILTGGALNYEDAALVLVDKSRVSRALNFYPGVLTPRVGWNLTKTGRTSGTTNAQVLAVNAVSDVGYGGGVWARFHGQVITGHMLDPGDSGSVGRTAGGYAAVLGFAGSDTVSIHTPISRVLTHLGVELA